MTNEMTYEQKRLHRRMRTLAIVWVGIWSLAISLLALAPPNTTRSTHPDCADSSAAAQQASSERF